MTERKTYWTADKKKKAADYAFEKIYYEYDENLLWIPFTEKKFLRDILKESYKLGHRQQDCIKYRGLIDLYFFTKSILGYNRLYPGTHRRPCDFLDKESKLKIMMMPRSFFKTTCGTKSKSLQILANDASRRILMVSNTATNAQKFLYEIERKCEQSALLQNLFPHLLPPKGKGRRWSSEAMEVKRDVDYSEASIEAIGIEGSSTSRHYDIVIEDDLVDEDQLINRDQMEKIIEGHKYIQYLYVQPRNKINFVYGTRWAYYDYLSYMLEEHSEYEVFKMAIVDENGKPTFPEEFPLQVIQKMQQEDPVLFSCQGMNDPLPGEMQDLKVDWLQFYQAGEEPPMESMERWILVDPTVGESEKSCFTAIATVGLKEEVDGTHIWVLDTFSDIVPIDSRSFKDRSLRGELFRRVKKYNPYSVAIESVAFQRTLKYLLRLHMEREKRYFHITEVPHYSTQNKWDRIMKLAGPMVSGRLHVRPDMKELMDEIKGCRLAKRIDLLDALSFITEIISTIYIPEGDKDEARPEDFSLEDILERLGGKESFFSNQNRQYGNVNSFLQ